MPAGQAPPPSSAATVAWNWVVEELACCKEFDSSILAGNLRKGKRKSILGWNRSIVADPVYGTGTSERVVLRFLEELVDWPEFAPSSSSPKSATATAVPGSRGLGGVAASTEGVLSHNSEKLGGSDNSDESCRTALRQFILQKRDALSKPYLDLLKDSILEECLQGASSSSRPSCFIRGDQVKSLHTDDADDIEIAAKKLKLSDRLIQQVKLLSAIPSEPNQNSLWEGAASGREDQWSKQNVQMVTDNNDACVTKQNVDPKFLAGKNKEPLDSYQMKTADNIKIVDVPTVGSPNSLSESSSDSAGYYDAVPDFHPNDEILAAEKLNLLKSQNPANNDSQIGDWTQQRSCIKCDEGGLVLICTGSGCPIAVHESCLGPSVEIANPEDFKCPFCSYLLAASAYYDARKRVSTARKILNSFMGSGRAGQKKVPPLMTGSNYMKKTSKGNHFGKVYGNQRSEIGKEPDRQNQAKATNDHKRDNCHVEEEHHYVDKNDGVIRPSGETELVNEYHVVSAKQNSAVITDKPCHADAAVSQRKETEKGSPSPETGGSEPSDRRHSHGHAQGLDHQQQVDPNTVSLHCESATREIQEEGKKVEMQGPAIERDVDPQKAPKFHSGESSSRKERKHQISARGSKRYTNPMFPGARRNRLPWTQEEEAVLKEAMQKFYQSGEKNISWIKIWEFGRHVFHKTRQPADLKDKWRNIRMRDG